MKFALLSDFHYGFPEDEDMEQYLEPVIDEMTEEINEQNPDFVVVLGDFIQHSEREEDIERLERVGELLQNLEAEVYGIPGNHDPMTVEKKEVIRNLDLENKETYFAVEKSGKKLIFLDTIKHIDDIYGAGMLGSEQREWLGKQLETDKEVLIFSHHLLHNRDLEGNWFFDEYPELATCIDKKQFLKIVENKPRAIFSAHIHEAGLETYRGIPNFTTSGMDKYNPPEQFEKNHAIVKVNEDEIVMETEGEKYRCQR